MGLLTASVSGQAGIDAWIAANGGKEIVQIVLTPTANADNANQFLIAYQDLPSPLGYTMSDRVNTDN